MSSSSSFELGNFLPYQLAVAAMRVSRGFTERYSPEHSLTIPEWRVLAQLASRGAISVREIHAMVNMDKSKVSRAATRLEEAGLIEKRESTVDRRLLDMRLTEAGKDLVERLFPIAATYADEIILRLGPDAPAFRRALQRLLEG